MMPVGTSGRSAGEIDSRPLSRQASPRRDRFLDILLELEPAATYAQCTYIVRQLARDLSGPKRTLQRGDYADA